MFRARLCSACCVRLLVALDAFVAVLVVAGVLVPAVGERGGVGDVVVVASGPGVLSVLWSAPLEPVRVLPSDYRVRWAAAGDPVARRPQCIRSDCYRISR